MELLTPWQQDYLGADVVQVLIDQGFAVGLHGHQHRPNVVSEKYRFGGDAKIVLIAAGTLCGGLTSLPMGERLAASRRLSGYPGRRSSGGSRGRTQF